MKNAHFVQHVQHLVHLRTSSKSLILKDCAACAACAGSIHAGARLCGCAPAGACVRLRIRATLHMLHMLHIHDFIKDFWKKMMHKVLHTLHKGGFMKKTIRCTPENAPQMRQVVAHWPELDALVRNLQAQNLFPGLRALEITLQGDQSWCGKGLAALLPENAPQAPKTGQAGAA